MEIRHIPGTSNKAADTLSRLNVLDNEDLEEGERLPNNDEEINCEISGVFGDDDITPVPDENWYNDYAADAEIMEYCFHAGNLRPEYHRKEWIFMGRR